MLSKSRRMIIVIYIENFYKRFRPLYDSNKEKKMMMKEGKSWRFCQQSTRGPFFLSVYSSQNFPLIWGHLIVRNGKTVTSFKALFLSVYRTVFDEGIDDIPSAGAPLDKFLCCDVCMRKDDKRRLAQIYCVICQKKFCTPHEKVWWL